jgi:hypothetical protein
MNVVRETDSILIFPGARFSFARKRQSTAGDVLRENECGHDQEPNDSTCCDCTHEHGFIERLHEETGDERRRAAVAW